MIFGAGKKIPKAKKGRGKNAKPSRARPKASTPSRKQSVEDAESSRRTRMFILGFFGFSAIAFGSTFGLDWLDSRAERILDATRAPVVTIDWPAWLPERSQREIETTLLDALAPRNTGTEGGQPGGRSIAQPAQSLSLAPLRRGSAALAASGWFEQPPRLVRGDQGDVSVDAVWRSPAAWVRWSGQDRVIDWLGRPLPVAETAVSSLDRSLPIILGARGGPLTNAQGIPLYDEPWASGSITPALQLLAVLIENGLSEQVRAIDTNRLDRAQELAVVTDRGATIVWGAPPGEWRPEDTRTDQEKIAVLRDLLDRTGRIDANERVLEIYGPYTVANDGP